MFHEGRLVEDGARLAFDLCIVGAGAAGLTVAREFVGSRTRVCVLESGGPAFSPDAQALSGGESVGHPYLPLAESRLRGLGGTLGWWAGECRPLDPAEDLGPRLWLGCPGWPVPAGEIAAFEPRARMLCGLSTQPFEPAERWLAACGQAALPLAPERFATRIFQYAPAGYLAATCTAALQAAGNVELFLNATAVAVETDGDGRVAQAVRVLSAPDRGFTIVAPAIVLAGGGIENARLLLASNAVRPAGLGNDHDQVGRNFMEHLFFDDVASFAPASGLGGLRLYGRRAEVLGCTVKAALAPTAAALAAAGIQNCCFKLASPLKRHPAMLAFMALRDSFGPGRGGARRMGKLARALVATPSLAGELARILRHGELGRPDRPRAMPVSVVVEQMPSPESRVLLSRTRDRLGQPKARLDWRLSELDRTGWLTGLALLAEDAQRRSLGRLQVPGAEEAAAALEGVRPGCHHIGTTRMAADPQHGVVDPDCRVHGLHGLFIAGSSVFATSGHANPTLTILLLALRLADHLKANGVG